MNSVEFWHENNLLNNKNSLDEMCMATPAVAGDRLLIRTLTKLYCFQNTR